MEGPAAPNLESNKAPPIHSKKGPKVLINPPTNQLVIIPSPVVFNSCQVSSAPMAPMINIVQCNQTLGLAASFVFLTPSSISISRKLFVRELPKIKANPRVVRMVKNVAPKLRLGLTSISNASNSMKPTLDKTKGTATRASKYPPNQATVEIINNSKRTIPLSFSAVAPIAL